MKRSNTYSWFFAGIILFIGVNNAKAQDWNDLNPVNAPDARFGHSMIHINGKVFLFGGGELDADGNVSGLFDDMWVLQDDWQSIEPANNPPAPRLGHAAAVDGDKLYIFGGQGDGGYYNDLWSYDINTKLWSELQTGNITPIMRKNASIAIMNEILYLYGGQTPCGINQSADGTYNMNSHTWQYWLTHAPSSGQSMVESQGTFYVFGGIRHNETDFRGDLRKCNPNQDNEFEYIYPANEGPSPRAWQSWIDNLEDLYIIGGKGPGSSSPKLNVDGFRSINADTVLSDTWKFNTTSSTWTRLADLPVGLSHAAAAVLDEQEGTIVLFGGLKSDGTVSGDTYIYGPEVTSTENIEEMPTDFYLSPSYPNPFNPATNITFKMSTNENVSLTVFDNLGRKVATLLDNENKSVGTHSLRWNAIDERGRRLSSGIYLLMMKAGNCMQTQKLMLLK